MCVTARTGADSYVNAQMVLLQQCGAIHNGLDMERWCVGLATCGVGLAMQDLAQLKSRRARGAVAESSTTAMPCLGGGAVDSGASIQGHPCFAGCILCFRPAK